MSVCSRKLSNKQQKKALQEDTLGIQENPIGEITQEDHRLKRTAPAVRPGNTSQRQRHQRVVYLASKMLRQEQRRRPTNDTGLCVDRFKELVCKLVCVNKL